MLVVVVDISCGADCCCTDASPSILAVMDIRIRFRSSVVSDSFGLLNTDSGSAMPDIFIAR